MKKNLDKLVYLASFILAVSVFLPITSFAVIGDVSFNRIAEMESYLIVLFAASAVLLLFLKQVKWLFVPVAGVWVTLFLPVIKRLLNQGDNGLLNQLSDKATGAMNDFAAELFLNVFQFAWGGYVFLAGLGLFTAACLLRYLGKK